MRHRENEMDRVGVRPEEFEVVVLERIEMKKRSYSAASLVALAGTTLLASGQSVAVFAEDSAVSVRQAAAPQTFGGVSMPEFGDFGGDNVEGPQTVVITEFYSETNQFFPDFEGPQASQEQNQEFLEIYNYGDEPINLRGWFISDPGDGTGEFAPAGTTGVIGNTDDDATDAEEDVILPPGGTAVLFNQGRPGSLRDPNFFPSDNFLGDNDLNEVSVQQATWGTTDPVTGNTILYVPLAPVIPFGLANSPNPFSDELIGLRDADGNLVDGLNYDDANPWPDLTPDGFSASLLPEFITPDNIAAAFTDADTGSTFGDPPASPQEANNVGQAWVRTDQFQPFDSDGNGTFDMSVRKVEGGRLSNEVCVQAITAIDPGSDPGDPVIAADVMLPIQIIPCGEGVDPESVPLGTMIAGGVTPGVQQEGAPGSNFASPGSVDITPDDVDQNDNGRDDDAEIFDTSSLDIDRNLILDDVDEANDQNNNGVPDSIEIFGGVNFFGAVVLGDPAALDCNLNGIIDEAELNGTTDANGNGRLDVCELTSDSFPDGGELIITEIHFDTPVDEGVTEWIEFWNASDEPIDVAGFGLTKLDLQSAGASNPETFTGQIQSIAGQSTVIQPGEAFAVISAALDGDGAPSAGDVTEFQAGWGTGFKVFPVTDFGFLANNGSVPGNEVPAIYAPPQNGSIETAAFEGEDGEPGTADDIPYVLIDSVDYDADETPFATFFGQDDLTWPDSNNASSIQLRPDALNSVDNNFGSNWELAATNGAISSLAQGAEWDSVKAVASPGFVATTEDPGTGEVVITEIFSVPNTPEIPTGIVIDDDGEMIELESTPQNEWVEIWNPGPTAVDVAGWYLQDEDGRTGPITAPLTVDQSTVLQPGEVAVIFGTDTDVDGTEGPFEYGCLGEAIFEFQNAWGGGYKVFVVEGWSFNRGNTFAPDGDDLEGLSNGPDRNNELLTLRRADTVVSDAVNWSEDDDTPDDEVFVGDWPLDSTGLPDLPSRSFTLDANALSGTPADAGFNDLGFAWEASDFEDEFDPDTAARQNSRTELFSTSDMAVVLMEASPGDLPGDLETPDLSDLIAFDACPLNAADIAAPFGTVDGADVNAFISAFGAQDDLADLNGDGTVDGADVNAFITAFGSGSL